MSPFTGHGLPVAAARPDVHGHPVRRSGRLVPQPNIALLFDLSGSVAPYIAQFRAAGDNFVTALRATPSAVALYTFASDAPANTTNNANVPLTPVTTAAEAAPLLTHINGFTATGGTNWDRGIWQIAASADHYDVAIVLTDGNPTYFGTGPSGPGNRTRFAELENGVFSANALKLKATRIIAVGIGLLEEKPGSIDNLRAISGTTSGSDYIETTFNDLRPVLERLALTNCAGIRVEKSAAPVTYDHVGQQIRYTWTGGTSPTPPSPRGRRRTMTRCPANRTGRPSMPSSGRPSASSRPPACTASTRPEC